jgi:formylglycine-generating enzyme required for sulfatase activity
MRRADLNALTITGANAKDRQCADGERLSIGGEAADIPLSGDRSRNEYAYIECRDGHPWLLPGVPTITVLLNERRLTDPSPLRDGDQVRIGAVSLACLFTGQTLQLQQSTGDPSVFATAPAAPTVRRGGRRLLRLGVLAMFAVLLLVAAFVFTATPVSVTITPEPEHLKLSGTLPVLKLQDRYLVYPGAYEISASKPGYQPLNRAADIRRGPHQELAFGMVKLPGRISLVSAPVAGAAVSVNGRRVGITPIRDLELPAGTHQIQVTAVRYQPVELDLDVEGMGRSQEVEVTLQPDWAPVSFASSPSGASLWIDNEEVGTTPATVDLLSGEHTVELRLDEHDPFRSQFTVVAGETMVLQPFMLTPSAGLLAINSEPVGASVTMDGHYYGVTPLELTLTPVKQHHIVLSRAGRKTVTKTVSLQAAASESLNVTLPAEYGALFIVSDLADARLYVDGKDHGEGARRLQLTTEPHHLEFKKPGYESYRVTVTPRAEVSKEVTVKLNKSTANPRRSTTATTVTTGEGQVLRLIGPGRFTMGASRREQGRRANEQLHQVELTRAFYLGVNEVTNGQFRRFNAEHSSGSAYGRSLDDDRQPVVGIRWEEAAAYLNWLSEKDGLTPAYVKQGEKLVAVRPPTNGYRLPTEAEWEYAARYAERSRANKYGWGDSYPPSGSAGNFADRAATGLLANTLSSYNDQFAVSAPVGSFSPNPLGIHDTGGNVAEWTHDFYDAHVSGARAVRDPLGPESGRHHVVRGAGWRHSTISELRLTFRDYSDKARQDLGFRIARYAK